MTRIRFRPTAQGELSGGGRPNLPEGVRPERRLPAGTSESVPERRAGFVAGTGTRSHDYGQGSHHTEGGQGVVPEEAIPKNERRGHRHTEEVARIRSAAAIQEGIPHTCVT